jgi:hypothetical protein
VGLTSFPVRGQRMKYKVEFTADTFEDADDAFTAILNRLTTLRGSGNEATDEDRNMHLVMVTMDD